MRLSTLVGRPTITTFVFVRHGDYVKAGLSESERAKAHITDKGRKQAAFAGQWLAKQGLKPDDLITTQAQRTKDTAMLVIRSAGAPKRRKEVSGGFGFGTSGGLDAKLKAWGCKGPVVFFIGHHTQQDYLVAKLAAPAAYKQHRAVLVYEKDEDGTWVFLDGVKMPEFSTQTELDV